MITVQDMFLSPTESHNDSRVMKVPASCFGGRSGHSLFYQVGRMSTAAWCGEPIPIVGSEPNRKRLQRQISIPCYKERTRLCTAPQMMFASNSPYSPFFTSGLLCHDIFDGIRRGSLPTPLSNQPEYRSFLSLDLAESQSMRSARSPPYVFSILFTTQLILLQKIV